MTPSGGPCPAEAVHLLDEERRAARRFGDAPWSRVVAGREIDRARAGWCIGPWAERPAQTERSALQVADVHERERHVEPVRRHRVGERAARDVDAARVARREREVAQELEPPLAEDLLRHLAADAEHPGDHAGVVLDRAV